MGSTGVEMVYLVQEPRALDSATLKARLTIRLEPSATLLIR